MHTFETPAPVDLKVDLRQGLVEVFAEETTVTTVELEAMHGDASAQEAIDKARVEQRGNDILVELPKGKSGLFRGRGEVRATIRVPLRSNAAIETGSADMELHGELGDLKLDSGSGDVKAEFGGDVAVRTGSGDIKVTTVAASLTSKSGSGDVHVEVIGAEADVMTGSGDVWLGHVPQGAKVKTGSGDVMLQEASGSIEAMAGSGDLRVKRVDQGRVRAKTGSGDVLVGVADGTAAYLDIVTVTGEVTSSLDASEAPGDGARTVELLIQSGTGDVVLQRA